ncbi:hypothetical protein [Brevibacillus reuszeri]|nr:hypothetical protein [Brevibacillus reuszeri]
MKKVYRPSAIDGICTLPYLVLGKRLNIPEHSSRFTLAYGLISRIS